MPEYILLSHKMYMQNQTADTRRNKSQCKLRIAFRFEEYYKISNNLIAL